MKPYYTWKQEFLMNRCCDESDFFKELLVASVPHVLLNLLLIFYLLIGTIVLRYIDYGIGKEEFPPALFFVFTTITTIGYGNICPTTERGKLCCMLYCIIGIPLVFLVLSNNGQFVADMYLIIRKSIGSETTASKGLPLWLSFALLFLHSVVGGLMFSTWMGQMRFFDAVYCSFISVSTIGYGDLVPVPDTWAHTVAIISFLSAGVIILSTIFQTFGCYLQYLHYIGRRFTGTKDVEIRFGGRVLTVQELITLVANQFGVCPRRLRAILRDLDNILEAACHDAVKDHPESLYNTDDAVRSEDDYVLVGLSLLWVTYWRTAKSSWLHINESRAYAAFAPAPRIIMVEGEERTALVTRDLIGTGDEVTPTYRIPSKTSMQLVVRDMENALQALRVIHNKLNKLPFRELQRE